MMLNLGLSGQPFAGCDIGGFADNADDEVHRATDGRRLGPR